MEAIERWVRSVEQNKIEKLTSRNFEKRVQADALWCAIAAPTAVAASLAVSVLLRLV